MRTRAFRVHWPTARLGLAVAAALGAVWLILPARAPAAEGVESDALRCMNEALCRTEPRMLERCTEILRAGVHRDLLGRRLPGVLAVAEALSRTTPDCEPSKGDPYHRGLCALWRQRPGDALLHWAELPKERGGLAFREVAAGLLRLRRHGGCCGRVAP
ncbi:MAG: hypothetical protein RBU30_04465 [Polyangia bacterium]|nr:hypothetical protein [Polyangia bacterium]